MQLSILEKTICISNKAISNKQNYKHSAKCKYMYSDYNVNIKTTTLIHVLHLRKHIQIIYVHTHYTKRWYHIDSLWKVTSVYFLFNKDILT